MTDCARVPKPVLRQACGSSIYRIGRAAMKIKNAVACEGGKCAQLSVAHGKVVVIATGRSARGGIGNGRVAAVRCAPEGAS